MLHTGPAGLAIAVLHMVPFSASACTSTATTAGNQAGDLTRGDFRASPVGVKSLPRPPPIQLARKSGASDPRYAQSLALGGSRVLKDSLSPIPVTVNSSTVKDLRWNSGGHLAPH